MADSTWANARYMLDICSALLQTLTVFVCLFGQLKSSPLHSFAKQRLKAFVHLTRSPSELCKTKRVACRQLQQPSLQRFLLLPGGLRGSWLKTCEASLPGTRIPLETAKMASMTLMFLTEFWILWPPFRFHGPPMLPGLQWWCQETRLCPTSMHTVLWISTFHQCLLDSRWLIGICGCPFFIYFVPQAGFLTSLRFLHGVKRQRAPWHISSTQQCWRPWRRITTSLWRIPLCGRCHSR